MAFFRSSEVDAFMKVLQEATRATPGGESQVFILPPGGGKADANYHHLIYGQRGSGKSTLMRHLQRERRREERVASWVDQEIFAKLSFPDVLVSSVETVMQDAATAVRFKVQQSRGLSSWWRRWSPHLSSTREDRELILALHQAVANLRVLKFLQRDRKVEWTHNNSTTSTRESLGILSLVGSKGTASAQRKRGRSDGKSVQVMEVVESSKDEFLERILPDFRAVLTQASARCGGGYIFLDDVYLLDRPDQPLVLSYMHRLVKDTGVWLKVGTIRYLTQTYRAGMPPVGIQDGHDAHAVALDAGIRSLNASQEFLEAILRELGGKVPIDLDSVFNDNALKRLALASGCVARDYLRLASEAIDQARNRADTDKTGMDRVTVEDVNNAAGKLAPTKFEDLAKDAPREAADLRALVVQLTEFCRDTGAAYFLVDAANATLSEKMNQLQHLRFAHLLDESETIPDRASQRFNVWLLDVAQLSATRATSSMDFIGWEKRERRRRRNLVFSEDAVKSNARSRDTPDTPLPGMPDKNS